MRTEADWLDMVTAVHEVHAEGEHLARWAGDVEEFVHDLLELAQAAYLAGYEDAVDTAETEGRDRVLKLAASFTYYEEL